MKTTFLEIASQREQMYESIGRFDYENIEQDHVITVRQKRGLINIIGSAMKTLFGVCDDECTKETNDVVDKIETSNVNMLHILKNQTTVVKSAVKGIGSATKEVEKLYLELGEKQQHLYAKINEAANHTHTIETLVLSNRIHSIFTALLTQFSYETTTISAIITAARTGVLHPNLVTPRELSKQLTQIKLNLPINLNLPMGTQPNEIYELSKITKMAVYYSGKQIVFLIKIPLITELELTLYKILPIPHQYNINHSIILKPEYQYVGITSNRRQFTTFTETQLLSCTETELFSICPEFQPIQHESVRQPCEISLFKNPDILPTTCEAGIIVITKNIYHKLKFANAWIYSTTNDTLTITCQGEKEPYILKIKNQGLIQLKQECRAYANDIVLNPSREIKSKYYVNFIPTLSIGSLKFKIPKLKYSVEIPKYKNKVDLLKLDNVHELAHSLDDIETMVNNELERQKGNETEEHHYLIYIIIGLFLFSLILILILYVMYRCNLDLNKVYNKRIKESENMHDNNRYELKEVKSKSTFYDYDISNSPTIKQSNLHNHEIRGPVVRDKSCDGDKELKFLKETTIEQLTDTPDRLSITNLPPILNK